MSRDRKQEFMGREKDHGRPHIEGTENQQNEQGSEEEFPGYPHYPPKEDIMSPSSEMKRVQVDVENLTPSGKYVHTRQESNLSGDRSPVDAAATPDDEDISMASGNESDVTKDDLLVLGGAKFSDNDLQSTARTNAVSGDDLDIPGAELDNKNEEIGEEDEENNYYSLGGDRHENLEEDPAV